MNEITELGTAFKGVKKKTTEALGCNEYSIRTKNRRAKMGTWFLLVLLLIPCTASWETVTGCVLKDPGMYFISLGNRTVLQVGENANLSCKFGYQIVPKISAKHAYEYDYPDSESTADPSEMPETEDNDNPIPVSDGNYTCRDNGKWEPEIRFSCEQIICDSFYGYNLENGHIFYSSRYPYTVGTVASFLCNPGYIRHGPDTRKCQINGTWSGECVTCQRIIRNPSITCPAPCVPEGARKTGSHTYEIGSRIEFHCPQSKSQDRDDRSRFKYCKRNGEYASWKGTKINCKEIICDKGDHYGFENGKVTYSSSVPTVGTKAIFMCNLGYNRRGPMIRICQKDGTWSRGCVTCQKHQHNLSTCPAPCVPDGAIRIGSLSYELGSKFQLYCFQSNTPYKVESRYTRHCVNNGKSASWNGTNTNCKAKCEPLADTYNVVQTGAVPGILSDKTVVELSCSGSLTKVLAECIDGHWYPKKPTCEDKENVKGNNLEVQVTQKLKEMIGLKEQLESLQKDTEMYISSFLSNNGLMKLNSIVQALAQEKVIRINFGKKINSMLEAYGQQIADLVTTVENIDRHIENRLLANTNATEASYGSKLIETVSTVEQKFKGSISKLNHTLENICEQINQCRVPKQGNGGWILWGSWSTCSSSCGNGLLHRSRTCTNPVPAIGGQYCDGQPTEYSNCQTEPCEAPQCGNGWTKFQASCYAFVHREMPWFAAEQYCQVFGSHLVRIDNYYELQFIQEKLYEFHKTRPNKTVETWYWTAGNDIMQEGHWVLTPLNVPMRYTYWYANEPNNNKGEEHCVDLSYIRLFRMNDNSCERNGFLICEIDVNTG